MNIRALYRAPRDIPEVLAIAPFTRRPKRRAIAEGGYLRDGAMFKRYDHRAARIPSLSTQLMSSSTKKILGERIKQRTRAPFESER